MKKEIVGVSFEREKLDALNYHMDKKDADLQAEMRDSIQKLYEKYVPQPTREYIEDRLAREAGEKPKRPVRRPDSPASSGPQG